MNTNKDVRRATRIRRKIEITNRHDRPRLSIFKSNRYISLQLIDDQKGITLAAAHEKKIDGKRPESLKALGKAMAEEIKKAKVTQVVFDRGPYRYQGVITVVADAIREQGVEF